MSTTPKDDGGAAFPTRERSIAGGYSGASDGMSLRDYFAGQALARIAMENPSNASVWSRGAKDVARDCYELADAMLAARKA